MRKLFVVNLILLVSYSVIKAQKLKKFYEDAESNSISSKQYNKLNDIAIYLSLERRTDSSITYYLKKRELVSKISEGDFNLLKNYIKDIDSTFDFSIDKLVIQYYPGKDQFNSGGNKDFILNSDLDLINRINQLQYVKSFFIAKDLLGLEFEIKRIPWHVDANHFIEKTFFPIHYPGGSFIIIWPYKRMYSFLGEYPNDLIFEKLK